MAEKLLMYSLPLKKMCANVLFVFLSQLRSKDEQNVLFCKINQSCICVISVHGSAFDIIDNQNLVKSKL